MFLWNLMSSTPTPTPTPDPKNDDWTTWVFIGVIALVVVVMFFFSSRANKKRQQEMQATLAALGPGNKVKTIGGICGVVVEVDRAENTFVLETGSETAGKSYMKFDMVAIYQTDAKKEEAPAEETVEAPVEEAVEETPFEEAPVEETAETSVEENE